jgi:hypothetical protein
MTKKGMERVRPPGGMESANATIETGAHGEMRLDLFSDVGVHAGTLEQCLPEAFHTNLRTRVTPLETLSQLDSASSRRCRPAAVSL